MGEEESREEGGGRLRGKGERRRECVGMIVWVSVDDAGDAACVRESRYVHISETYAGSHTCREGEEKREREGERERRGGEGKGGGHV